eukprot:TRINITY_DN2221_c0_g1_i2.p1 TRINITY_DN2221_c0_g1~~TRINITY_DN2221_c0_g1_i2.p1  ORF type:complete len:280 (-),score=18.31 TRINITY_DN2221_c0_g1_i2:16-855(-)
MVSVLNNVSFAFSISQPIHMIFRSSSLVVTFLLGSLPIKFFNKKYTKLDFAAVLAVTVGIVLVLNAEYQMKSQSINSSSTQSCTDCGKLSTALPIKNTDDVDYTTWVQGIGILTLTVVLSSFLSYIQEYAYQQYSSHWTETIFYCHAMGIICFVSMFTDLGPTAMKWSSLGFVFDIPGVPKSFTSMWLAVVVNIVTQFICVTGVYQMVATSGPLANTVAITFRKFVSLLMSIWYFQNPFGYQHWFGTILVFSGVIVYSLKRYIISFLNPVNNETKTKSE